MCARPPSPRTPSVRTCGCSTSSSTIADATCLPLLDELALKRQRVGVRDAGRAAGLRAIDGTAVCAAGHTVFGSQFSSACLTCDMNSSATAPSIDAVIVAERQVRHRPDRDRVVDDDRTLLDVADAEDRDLRLVDDRHPEQRAEHARIGDRERAAGHFVGLELLRRARGRRDRRSTRLRPSRFFSSAFLMTGTIRPQSSATAMPMLTSL